MQYNLQWSGTRKCHLPAVQSSAVCLPLFGVLLAFSVPAPTNGCAYAFHWLRGIGIWMQTLKGAVVSCYGQGLSERNISVIMSNRS